MSKQVVPLVAEDISHFSRALSKQLEQNDQPLSHVRMLNLIAKANGFRNFQHLRASHKSSDQPSQPAATEAIDLALVERCFRRFSPEGLLKQWPSRGKVQKIVLWVLWSAIPSGKALTEQQINECLNAHHAFEDPATLRRIMIGFKMLERKKDGSEYFRIEQKPPAEALELIRRVKEQRSA